jgi:hypothetical protein
MKRLLTGITLFIAFGTGSGLAETADHAPTKPAADAAARYDRSLERNAPANSRQRPDDGVSGASSGTGDPDPLVGGGKAAPADRESSAPNSTMDKPK